MILWIFYRVAVEVANQAHRATVLAARYLLAEIKATAHLLWSCLRELWVSLRLGLRNGGAIFASPSDGSPGPTGGGVRNGIPY